MYRPRILAIGLSLFVAALTCTSIAAQVPLAKSDVDGDCLITTTDVAIVRANLGTRAPLPRPAADVNGDRRVNTTDLNLVMRNVGKTVCSANGAPVASAGPDQRVVVGQVVRLSSAGSTDPDADPLTFAWAFLVAPAGSAARLTADTTAAPSFVPDLPGTYDLRLTVRDGRGGHAADDVRVIADAGNSAPVITSAAIAQAQAGMAYVYDVDATDADGDPLVYTLPLAPAGMAIDQSTGVINWTPTAQQAGIRSALVQVDDGRGGTTNQGVAIEVQAPVNHPPAATDDRYDVGLGQTLLVPAAGVLANDSDPDSQPLTARLMSLPGEGRLTFQPDGGFTYTPRGLVAPGALDPIVEWSQATFRVAPTSTQIMMTPTVIDANRDGTPEIYVATHAGNAWTGVGHLRALAGGPTTLSNTNLVRLKGTTVQASSTFGTYVPERAIDGDLQTSWFSARGDTSAFYQVSFASAAVVRRLRMFGNRQFPSGHDLLGGRFDLLDAAGSLLYTSGTVSLPAPDRDIDLTLAVPVAGVRRVRFTATGVEVPTADHGFAELEIIGDAVAAPGTELWTVANEVHGSSGIAAADIDGDGFSEIVAQGKNGGLVAFEHDGTIKWRSVGLGLSGSTIGSPSIADLDNDGTPEIVVGSAVLSSDGTLRWGPKADTGDNGWGPVSTVVDLDLDGRPEILTGRSAYRADGSVYWTSSLREGLTAVGNFDLDPYPEIVSVTRDGVRLLEHDGKVKWGPVALPGGGRGGPPTIADVDADGQPEIGVAGSTRYVVFETDGSVKWQVETQDGSSNVTGSSVFDFEGDGRAEIVYADELFLRILRGTDGAVLYQMEKGSATLHEIPAIADVDGDGRAEIVVGANNWSYGTVTGLFVIGGAGNDWVATRAIWNQHAYHVTNVNADGTVPAIELQHWLVPGLNAFRTNAFAPGDPDRTTSFTYRVGDGELESSDAVVRITLRQPNSPPVFQPIPAGAAAVGLEYLYGATIIDPDLGDVHTFALIAGPTGMIVEPSTGLVRWTPAAAQRGDHAFTLRVLDHRGLFDDHTFMVRVGTPVAVPDVTAKTQAAAQAAVLGAGLSVAPVATTYSTTVALGRVISQTPLAGALVAATTPVYLEVSAGLKPVTVPTLIGLTQADAAALLASKELALGVVTLGTSNTARAGTVIVQSPAAGTVAGITTPVNVTVSAGPAIALTLTRSVVQAGDSTSFVVEAYGPDGQPLQPLPAVSLTLTAEPDAWAGSPPAVTGGVITTSSDTRGRFTLQARLASGDTASAALVVTRPGTVGSAAYATLGRVMTDMAEDLRRLESAVLSSDLAAIPSLRTALLTTRDRIDLDSLAGSTAFAPEGGFPPTLAALSTAGFPETTADVSWNTALRNVIATLKSIETVLVQLSSASPVDDDARLTALNAELEARVATLLAIRPTLHGVVKRANVVNQLVSIRIPRLIDAQAAAIDRALRAGGLARTLEPVERFYAGIVAPASIDPIDPAAFYAQRRPTFFSLPSLMSATRIQMGIIKNLYAPILGEVSKSALLLASRDLMVTYTNAGSLVGVVTGASVSLQVFGMPGSVIEGFGFDRDFPEGNQVYIIGPSTIDEFRDMLAPLVDRPESFDDLDEMVDFFEGVRDGAKAFTDAFFDEKNLYPSGVVRGCIFDFSSACSELVYDEGFRPVHKSGSFPAPVLFLVRNVSTGSWGVVLASFFPSH